MTDQRVPVRDCPFDSALEGFRLYLLEVARRRLDPGLRSKAGASDLVQETLIDGQRHLFAFQGRSEREVLAWLRKSLLNNVSKLRRRYRGTAKRSVGREVAAEDVALACDDLASNPAEATDRAEQARWVRGLLQQLAPDHAQVLSLWLEEKSFDEIGPIIGRSADAARMLWMRAVRRLREIANAPEGA